MLHPILGVDVRGAFSERVRCARLVAPFVCAGLVSGAGIHDGAGPIEVRRVQRGVELGLELCLLLGQREDGKGRVEDAHGDDEDLGEVEGCVEVAS